MWLLVRLVDLFFFVFIFPTAASSRQNSAQHLSAPTHVMYFLFSPLQYLSYILEANKRKLGTANYTTAEKIKGCPPALSGVITEQHKQWHTSLNAKDGVGRAWNQPLQLTSRQRQTGDPKKWWRRKTRKQESDKWQKIVTSQTALQKHLNLHAYMGIFAKVTLDHFKTAKLLFSLIKDTNLNMKFEQIWR